MRLPALQFWYALRGLCRGVRGCALFAGLLFLATHPSVASAQLLNNLLNSGSTQPSIPPSPPHPSVARIVVEEKTGISYGSGTLIDIRENVGLVITNWHVVVDGAGPVTVIFPNGFQSPARVLLTDKDWDLAALAIWKPDVAPVAISDRPPIIGEPLAIGGYGSGQWRLAVGKCTQYVAPAENLPYEMVEVSAEARQGDSGGPIFNARGELAGVLFGASRGTTSGSFCGRVNQFLKPILNGNAAADTAAPAAENSLAARRPSIPIEPVADDRVIENNGWIGRQVPVRELPPDKIVRPEFAKPREEEGWKEPLPRRAMPVEPVVPLADSSGDVSSLTAHAPNAVDDHRLASVAPAMRRVERLDSADEGLVYSPLPPRPGTTATTPAATTFPALPSLTNNPGAGSANGPWNQLLQQFAGNSLFDQIKTGLAALGILTVLYRFLAKEPTEEASPD